MSADLFWSFFRIESTSNESSLGLHAFKARYNNRQNCGTFLVGNAKGFCWPVEIDSTGVFLSGQLVCSGDVKNVDVFRSKLESLSR